MGVLGEHKDWVRDIDFSCDGKLLVSVSKDKTVRIWELENKTCLHILKGHKRNVQEVRFSHNAQYLVSWSWEGIICIWETKTGKKIQRIRGKSHIDHLLDHNTKYRIVSSSLRTIVMDKNTDEIIASLPQTIDLIAINKHNTIFGSTGSGYLPIFKLEK